MTAILPHRLALLSACSGMEDKEAAVGERKKSLPLSVKRQQAFFFGQGYTSMWRSVHCTITARHRGRRPGRMAKYKEEMMHMHWIQSGLRSFRLQERLKVEGEESGIRAWAFLSLH